MKKKNPPKKSAPGKTKRPKVIRLAQTRGRSPALTPVKNPGPAPSTTDSVRAGARSDGEDVDLLSVGHVAQGTLRAADERLFKAFQANLLSLVSHELRTPLTGIMNALGVLEHQVANPPLLDESATILSTKELVNMARRNAERLHESLAMLLDLAALESGAFQARLKEVDLTNLIYARVRSFLNLFTEAQIDLDIDVGDQTDSEGRPKSRKVLRPALADPQKLGRAIELCFQIIVQRARAGTRAHVRVDERAIHFDFDMKSELKESFENSWVQASAGAQGGVLSPTSAFRGTLQSEQGFLSRTEEGLGSELLLVHEILKLHRGSFQKSEHGESMRMSLTLPELSPADVLREVLLSRVFQTSTGLGTVALGLLDVPKEVAVRDFHGEMRRCLFRATDAVYELPEQNRVALVMDDCRKEDAPRILARIEKAMGRKLAVGFVSCPEEASDPELLIEIAERRLAEHRKTF